MNRVTVILLALVILLAHSLAIHQTADGSFAAPYEIAHGAFRVARHLIHLGSPAWNQGGATVESYPSPLWVLICAVPERLYVRSGLFAQVVGVICMLVTVGVLAQFSPKRMAGLVAPLLLAASGSAAAAGSSGTEAPLVMLLATTAFLAMERGWPRLLALSATLLALSRPEGPWVVLGLLFLTRFAGRGANGPRERRPMAAVFALPLACIALLTIVRKLWLGTWLSPFEADILAPVPGQWILGLHYLESFLLQSGSAPLAVLPLGALVIGRLSGTGVRALFVVALWSGLVALSGGDRLPLWNALAPLLPLFFLSIQESITAVLDRRPGLAAAAWSLLLLAVCASFLVSKTPSNIGPFPIEDLQREWMRPDPVLEEAYGRPLGRQGLAAEIRDVVRLRALSAFLREKIGQPSTILTPWPGAIACLSRKRVYDLLGRATVAPGETRIHSWRGTPRLDIVRVFDSEPDYVVPVIDSGEEGSAPVSILHDWLRRYDLVGDDDERLLQLLTALSRYELISVPVFADSLTKGRFSGHPFLLLRSRRLGLAPKLEIEIEGDEFEILARHRGPHQVVDLRVWTTDENGRVRTMRPTGEFVPGDTVVARSDVLLHATGPRSIRMVAGTLPADPSAVRLSAKLFNPGTAGDSPLSGVGSAVSVPLER